VHWQTLRRSSMKFYKKWIGKHVVIRWKDIKTLIRVEFDEVFLADCETTGKVVEVKPNLILCHDTCEELGDYTILPPGVVYQVDVLD